MVRGPQWNRKLCNAVVAPERKISLDKLHQLDMLRVCSEYLADILTHPRVHEVLFGQHQHVAHLPAARQTLWHGCRWRRHQWQAVRGRPAALARESKCRKGLLDLRKNAARSQCMTDTKSWCWHAPLPPGLGGCATKWGLNH